MKTYKQLIEELTSAEKLERSKYRQGEDEAKANIDSNNPKNPKRYKRRRKVTKARQEKETRKAQKDYYNTTGTSDDAKKRSEKLFKIGDMSSKRRGHSQAYGKATNQRRWDFIVPPGRNQRNNPY